jgi:outer membrane protein, heavy metal efflux system
MKKIMLLNSLLLLTFAIFAQTETSRILSEIEKNNTTLEVHRNLNEAQKMENQTGIYLENPEVEYHYLWGSPAAIGKRQDVAVKQSFDFPTSYGLKKKIAGVQNEQADLEYRMKRSEVLFQAKTVCTELIYLNAMHRELEIRERDAADIFKAYEVKFENGETNIIEKNKARLNLLNAQKAIRENETQRNVLLAELKRLNGGVEIDFSQNDFAPAELPANFDAWFEENRKRNLLLQMASRQTEMREKQVKLSKALNLPKFSTNYMSESVEGEAFKGIALGMTIPLWEKKNTVKVAGLQHKVAEEMAADAQVQSYNRMKSHYEKALQLQKTLNDYTDVLESVNSTGLLKKALDAGEISLIDYLMELSLYYKTVDNILSMKNELYQALAGLYYYEL